MFNAGDVIAGYTLEKRIGQGGFGTVWLAVDENGLYSSTTNNKRKVAVKVVRVHSDKDDTALFREAHLWSKLSGHTHVISFIEAKKISSTEIILVSEFAEGGTLEQFIKDNGVVPMSKAVDIICEILIGLDYLHSKNIVHRDIKPANILLKDNRFCLADFGISTIYDTGLTQSTEPTGTPLYMSPESFNGYRNFQTDVWAIGVIFYQLLSGKLPFEGNNSFAVMHAITNNTIKPLPDGVPALINDIVFCALEKNTNERYHSAEQMRKQLGEARIWLDPAFLTQKIKSLEKRNEEIKSLVIELVAISSKINEEAIEGKRLVNEFSEKVHKNLFSNKYFEQEDINTFVVCLFFSPILFRIGLEQLGIYYLSTPLLPIYCVGLLVVFRVIILFYRKYANDVNKMKDSIHNIEKKSQENANKNIENSENLAKLINALPIDGIPAPKQVNKIKLLSLPKD